MNTLRTSRLGLIAALALAGMAYGQVPATNDTSDSGGNTGMGTGALGGPANSLETIGGSNTACGFNSLYAMAGVGANGGKANTACGAYSLYGDTTSSNNTAFGAYALSGIGPQSGAMPVTGENNTAVGYYALGSDTTGSSNTATGVQALYENTTGNDNVAFGAGALQTNNGNGNVAFGYNALFTNSLGDANTAVGLGALVASQSANNNTALGYWALYDNTTGKNNIALGYRAGYKAAKANNDIAIGFEATANQGNIIQIGTGKQTATYIAGIYGNTSVNGLPVVIGSNGQLGTTSSAERFKTAIAPMGSRTGKLKDLRPVSFRYKSDPQGTLRYGLIAEEVAKVYPELVVRDRKGRIDGVRYDELAPMLLNELQRGPSIDQLEHDLAAMQAALTKVQFEDQRMARR